MPSLAALKRHRKEQLEEKLKAGGVYEDDGLVFATAKGTPLDEADREDASEDEKDAL